MEFIETSVFTKQIRVLLDDDAYRDLQAALARHPKMGDVIPGGHGLRKLRWGSAGTGRGKRVGIRIIYYYWSAEQVYLLFAYEKSRQGDLTPDQVRMLSAYVRRGVL